MKKKVAIAISGGVDSSVSAWLLKEQGYELIALHMKLYHGVEGEKQRAKSCCALDEARSARAVCEQLELPFYVLDFQDEFQDSVIQYFVDEYVSGRTPNPCVMCNRAFKSHYLLQQAQDLGCDFLATGHYARTALDPSGRTQLLQAKDAHKDQSYFLHGIDAEDLSHFLFPLAEYQKSEVRDLAEQQGFVSAKKPESQDICFVNSNYRDFLKTQFVNVPAKGDFVDTEGNILGTHNGLPFYTIGQRRGLGISDATPYYVVHLNTEKNQVILGKNEDLFSQNLWVSETNWISIPPPQKSLTARVQLRYSHSGASATLHPEDSQRVYVEFDEPQRAVAPGQAAVFYHGDVLLGGGWIETKRRKESGNSIMKK